MKEKSWMTRLEKMGSLTHIIWSILGLLLLIYIGLTYADSIAPDQNKVSEWGKIDLKGQLP